MSDTSSRRRLLALLGTGVLTTAAGCLGDDFITGDDDDGTADDTNDDTGDGTADDSGDDTGDGTADDGAAGDDGEQTLSGVVDDTLLDEDISYQVDFRETGEDEWTGTQLVYGEDFYVSMTDDVFGEIEMYRVDDEVYGVFEGEDCLKGWESEDENMVNIHYSDISVEETTTIDGEEAYVFEDGDQTIYVSTASRYPIRMEGPDFVAEFHSWGEVDPRAPPDMECEEGL